MFRRVKGMNFLDLLEWLPLYDEGRKDITKYFSQNTYLLEDFFYRPNATIYIYHSEVIPRMGFKYFGYYKYLIAEVSDLSITIFEDYNCVLKPPFDRIKYHTSMTHKVTSHIDTK